MDCKKYYKKQTKKTIYRGCNYLHPLYILVQKKLKKNPKKSVDIGKNGCYYLIAVAENDRKTLIIE